MFCNMVCEAVYKLGRDFFRRFSSFFAPNIKRNDADSNGSSIVLTSLFLILFS